MIALIVYSFTSCQEKANTLKINNTKSIINKKTVNKSQNTDFLKNLQDICVEDDGVFKNCDELFTKDGSSLFFIIIPKITEVVYCCQTAYIQQQRGEWYMLDV